MSPSICVFWRMYVKDYTLALLLSSKYKEQSHEVNNKSKISRVFQLVHDSYYFAHTAKRLLWFRSKTQLSSSFKSLLQIFSFSQGLLVLDGSRVKLVEGLHIGCSSTMVAERPMLVQVEKRPASHWGLLLLLVLSAEHAKNLDEREFWIKDGWIWL